MLGVGAARYATEDYVRTDGIAPMPASVAHLFHSNRTSTCRIEVPWRTVSKGRDNEWVPECHCRQKLWEVVVLRGNGGVYSGLLCGSLRGAAALVSGLPGVLTGDVPAPRSSAQRPSLSS